MTRMQQLPPLARVVPVAEPQPVFDEPLLTARRAVQHFAGGLRDGAVMPPNVFDGDARWVAGAGVDHDRLPLNRLSGSSCASRLRARSRNVASTAIDTKHVKSHVPEMNRRS